jgi:tetratricopeptide (TPR) repeat protein
MILQAHEFIAEAKECFEQAQRSDPAEARWPYLHALLLSEVDADDARVRMQLAADLAPASTDAPRLRLAQWLFESGRPDEAEGHFKKLLQTIPGHALARLGLAEVSQARGRHEDALRMIEPCLTNAYTARRAHILLGQVERRLGRPAAAEAAIHRASALPPDWSWPDPFSSEAAQYRIGRKAWTEQARQFLDEGRPETAQPLIARLIQDYADAPESWLLLGRARLGSNDCPGAERAFRRVLQLAPESVNGLAQLGATLLCQERHAEAVPVFQR